MRLNSNLDLCVYLRRSVVAHNEECNPFVLLECGYSAAQISRISPRHLKFYVDVIYVIINTYYLELLFGARTNFLVTTYWEHFYFKP